MCGASCSPAALPCQARAPTCSATPHPSSSRWHKMQLCLHCQLSQTWWDFLSALSCTHVDQLKHDCNNIHLHVQLRSAIAMAQDAAVPPLPAVANLVRPLPELLFVSVDLNLNWLQVKHTCEIGEEQILWPSSKVGIFDFLLDFDKLKVCARMCRRPACWSWYLPSCTYKPQKPTSLVVCIKCNCQLMSCM